MLAAWLSWARGADERGESLCARVCQLPQALAQGAAFVRDPGSEHARLSGGTSRDGDDGGGVVKRRPRLSPLDVREQREAAQLQRFLLAGQPSEANAADGAAAAAAEVDAARAASAGEACGICTANPSTHVAQPCQHSACQACWSRWLAKHPGCMTCTFPVEELRRFPTSVVPLTLCESSLADRLQRGESDAAVAVSLVEQGTERCVRAMLECKDQLAGVLAGLRTVEKHLAGMTQGQAISMDSFTSVLAVEQSAVADMLKAYRKLFRPGQAWDSMEQEVAALDEAVARLGRAVDRVVDRRAACAASPTSAVPLTQQEDNAKAPAEAPAELQAAAEALELLVAPTALLAQWAQLEQLLHTLGASDRLVPGLVRIFAMVQFSAMQSMGAAADIPGLARESMSMASSKARSGKHRIGEALVPEAALLLERVRSLSVCFELT